MSIDDDAVRWFLDSVKPSPPSVTIVSPAPLHNGWFNSAQGIQVNAPDPAPSSGMATGAVALHLDGVTIRCGAAKEADGTGGDSTVCPLAETAAIAPGNGVHEYTAETTDAAGNTSDTSEPLEVRIDNKAPTSKLELVPAVADGTNGWYRTRPVVAFGTTDNAGGSGVDPTLPDSGVRFSVDGAAYQWWDPADAGGYKLFNGTHKVCWYAVDVAGNPENGGQSGAQCQSTIRVDVTEPVPGDHIAPTGPDGANSWYTSEPTIAPAATDPTPGSGVASVEQRIDEGPWQPAASTPIAEGTHVVNTRATDQAGNVSVGTERTVQVDETDPTDHLDPSPAAQQPGLVSPAGARADRLQRCSRQLRSRRTDVHGRQRSRDLLCQPVRRRTG